MNQDGERSDGGLMTDYVIGGPDHVRNLAHDLRSLLGRMDPPAFSAIWQEVASDEHVDMLERDLCQCVTCIDMAQLINRIRVDASVIETYKQQHTNDLVRQNNDAATIAELRGIVDTLKRDIKRLSPTRYEAGNAS